LVDLFTQSPKIKNEREYGIHGEKRHTHTHTHTRKERAKNMYTYPNFQVFIVFSIQKTNGFQRDGLFKFEKDCTRMDNFIIGDTQGTTFIKDQTIAERIAIRARTPWFLSEP
jgi:hypothetical protein